MYINIMINVYIILIIMETRMIYLTSTSMLPSVLPAANFLPH